MDERAVLAEAGKIEIKSDKPILWAPYPKQSTFLSADEDEVLYGGAAGGGKTDAALINSLGLHQRAIFNRNYTALILRRTFGELKSMIERGRYLYEHLEGEWNGSDKHFRFPSRATVEFGYLKRDSDRFQYQGRDFQDIDFEEITQYAGVYDNLTKTWGPAVSWEYLKSRNRSADPSLKCYMRATTNPGNIGSKWVQSYWRIPDAGTPTCFPVEIDLGNGTKKTIWRRFIPARLFDNPSLAADGNYHAKLMGMSEMDRRALLDGRWDVVEIPGQIYKAEMEAAITSGRICRVPYVPGYPVYTFWDLGRNNATGIWCMQKIGIEYRFINYYEDRLTGLQTYIKWLQDTGYTFATHYLPHDGDVEELIANRSRKSVLEDAKIGKVECVDRINELQDGIDMVRRMMPMCLWDAENCDLGLTGLKSYRYEWNEIMQVWRPVPVHDWATTACDSFRQFAQGFLAPTEKKTQRKKRTKNWRTA